jgi:hypothetical protein
MKWRSHGTVFRLLDFGRRPLECGSEALWNCRLQQASLLAVALLAQSVASKVAGQSGRGGSSARVLPHE